MAIMAADIPIVRSFRKTSFNSGILTSSTSWAICLNHLI